jgi:hypothetical protein
LGQVVAWKALSLPKTRKAHFNPSTTARFLLWIGTTPNRNKSGEQNELKEWG